ncbi:phosphopantetheine-binding protein [Streptomyces sp. MMBL 11-3]|uniref:phosphopantetheine-binding protein n=1 Tax=Streptomyces sp. MMBL 11-3 TaxID=3382639 RepID=UPI0039B42468
MNSDLESIVRTHLNVPPPQVRPEATWDDLGFDSLSLAELSLLLTEHTHLDISDRDLQQARTLGAVSDLLEQKLAQR